MKALVTFNDLNDYKYIADSVRNTTSWPQFVSEAQMFDVKNWLGDALLLELVTQGSTSPTSYTAANQKLMDGGSYEYQDCTYHFQGLKAAIIYYAFGRFTNRTPYNYTAAGIVTKDSDFSEPVTDKVVQRLETEARLMADAIRDEITLFLNRNRDDYPLWEGCGCSINENRTRTFKVLGE